MGGTHGNELSLAPAQHVSHFSRWKNSEPELEGIYEAWGLWRLCMCGINSSAAGLGRTVPQATQLSDQKRIYREI